MYLRNMAALCIISPLITLLACGANPSGEPTPQQNGWGQGTDRSQARDSEFQINVHVEQDRERMSASADTLKISAPQLAKSYGWLRQVLIGGRQLERWAQLFSGEEVSFSLSNGGKVVFVPDGGGYKLQGDARASVIQRFELSDHGLVLTASDQKILIDSARISGSQLSETDVLGFIAADYVTYSHERRPETELPWWIPVACVGVFDVCAGSCALRGSCQGYAIGCLGVTAAQCNSTTPVFALTGALFGCAHYSDWSECERNRQALLGVSRP